MAHTCVVTFSLKAVSNDRTNLGDAIITNNCLSSHFDVFGVPHCHFYILI